MLVRELLASPVVTIRPDHQVVEAARLLDRLSLTSLPVADADLRLLGIIDGADLISQIAMPTRTRAGGLLVRDLMTPHVLTVDADDDVARIVALMSRTSSKSLPVLLHDRVVGVISRRDNVRAIAQGEVDGRHVNELSRA